MKSLTRREWVHVAAMLGVLVLGVRCGAAEPEGDGDHAHLTLQNALLVSDRHALQLCVELSPALEGRSTEVLAALEADLDALEKQHPDWERAGFGRAPVRVQRGCPGGALAPGRLEGKGAMAGPGLSLRPSPFRTFIHVLDDEAAREVLGEQPAVRARAELMQVNEHQSVEVSSALVIRASALGTAAFREEWLPSGVGLMPLVQPPEPDATLFVPKQSGGDAP